MQIGGLEIPSDSPVFLAILAIHVSVGVLAAVTGAVAMLMEKRRGGHTRTGSIYFRSVATLFATSTALAALRWTDDYHLFALGTQAFAAALLGRAARRRRWRTQIDMHIVGMGVSYIAMLTASYVDNGGNLPVWRELPDAAYWLAPSAFGIALVVWAVARGSKVAIHVEGRSH